MNQSDFDKLDTLRDRLHDLESTVRVLKSGLPLSDLIADGGLSYVSQFLLRQFLVDALAETVVLLDKARDDFDKIQVSFEEAPDRESFKD